jgi:hypothetical protein
MIRDVKRWREWEAEYIASAPADYSRNLELFEAMYEQARELGLFPLADPLEGLDAKVHLARVVNLQSTAPNNRSRA